MGYVLSGALIFAGLLAYISGSPFVFIELFDVPPERFGLYFGINAIGIMTASQINRWLAGRVETHRDRQRGAAGRDDGAAWYCWSTLHGFGGFAGILVPLFFFIACHGFVLPNTTALAMAPHGRRRQRVRAARHIAVRRWRDCRQPGRCVRQRHGGAAGGGHRRLRRYGVSREPVRDDLTRAPRRSAGKRSAA